MEVSIQIGKLAQLVEEYKGIVLADNCEENIRDLGCKIETPSGFTYIDYIIKKENLIGIRLLLENGIEVKCAKKHILRKDNRDIFAECLVVGDLIATKHGNVAIEKIEDIADSTFYDIGIDYPHLYYDADGVLHHNTIMTAAMSHSVEPYGRSIVIVPNKSLVTQTEKDYKNLGLDVGVYFGDRKEYNKTHTICTWQSLNNLLKTTKSGEAAVTIDDFIEGVVCVIVDEVHMAKADALKTLLTGVMSRVPIRWGLTGTIPKEQFEYQALHVSIGPVINRLAAAELQDRGVLAQCHVNIVQLVDHVEYSNYQSELKYLLEESGRLDTIAALVQQVNNTGNTLVLVDRISAGQALVERLGDRAVFISGATKAGERQEHYDEVSESVDKIIVATYGVAAVGINIPRIFNLVLLEPGKSFVRVIQSIGRGIRKAEDKDHVQIWDVTSTCKFAKRHLTKRKTFYREANYPFTQERLEWMK